MSKMLEGEREKLLRMEEQIEQRVVGQHEAVRRRPYSQIGYLKHRLADRDMALDVSDAALDLLGEAGFDPVYGARQLERAIRAQLENPLAQEILAGHFRPGDTVTVDAQDGKAELPGSGREAGASRPGQTQLARSRLWPKRGTRGKASSGSLAALGLRRYDGHLGDHFMSSPFEVAMMQEVSVAEAKSRLTSLLHEVEAGAPVQITRRGKAVAVLLSEAEYAALKAREPTQGLWETISRWRAETVPDWPDLGPEEVDAWRDRTPAKDFDWPE